MLFVAAIFVAAFGSGLARGWWLDPPGVRPARLPWRELWCFQLVLAVGVFVGAAKPAAMLAATMVVTLVFGLFLIFVKALGVQNETTLLEQFPMGKKSDGIDLKLLAGICQLSRISRLTSCSRMGSM